MTQATSNAATPQARIKFPVKLEAGGRKFTLSGIDTRELWRIYAQYEAILMGMMPQSEDGVINMTGQNSGAVIDLMIELIELCEEDGFGALKGQFGNRFAPGEDTPLVLMEKVAEALFGPFFEGAGQGNYQPLTVRLAQPLVNAMGS